MQFVRFRLNSDEATIMKNRSKQKIRVSDHHSTNTTKAKTVVCLIHHYQVPSLQCNPYE
jgi:hypothetical protein